MGDMDILFPVPTGGRNADDMGMPAPIKEEKRCIWCEALEGDHSAPVCSGPDGRGHHFRKTPWVTPNAEITGD